MTQPQVKDVVTKLLEDLEKAKALKNELKEERELEEICAFEKWHNEQGF